MIFSTPPGSAVGKTLLHPGKYPASAGGKINSGASLKTLPQPPHHIRRKLGETGQQTQKDCCWCSKANLGFNVSSKQVQNIHPREGGCISYPEVDFYFLDGSRFGSWVIRLLETMSAAPTQPKGPHLSPTFHPHKLVRTGPTLLAAHSVRCLRLNAIKSLHFGFCSGPVKASRRLRLVCRLPG